MLDKLDHPVVIDFVEKRPNIKIEHPVHFLACDSNIQRVQRIVLAAPRSESVREAQKVLFPYLVEDRSYRGLDDLILQRREGQRELHLSTVSIWDGRRSVTRFIRFEVNASKCSKRDASLASTL